MNDERKIVFVMVGHTAAGKTTFARSFCEKYFVDYISEGEIKRSFVSNYTSKNSLDEELRDRGYAEAIKRAVVLLAIKDSVLIDASFHKKKRRINLTTEIGKHYPKAIFVWVYCICPSYDKVVKRIEQRDSSPKTADNQADDIAIYSHILNSFDDVSLDQFFYDTVIIAIDTNKNDVINIESNFNFVITKNKLLASVFSFSNTYLKSKRSEND